jgi:hypothetical protein
VDFLYFPLISPGGNYIVNRVNRATKLRRKGRGTLRPVLCVKEPKMTSARNTGKHRGAKPTSTFVFLIPRCKVNKASLIITKGTVQRDGSRRKEAHSIDLY